MPADGEMRIGFTDEGVPVIQIWVDGGWKTIVLNTTAFEVEPEIPDVFVEAFAEE
jgi:hypothetical protein